MAIKYVGLCCPKCGGKKIPAVFTRRRADRTVRHRACSACGHRFRTCERIESVGRMGK